MADEGSMMKIPGLKGIRRALDKNQIYTNELKKELHHIDEKRKTSEKAFEMKRLQFMRKSLCLKNSGKQHDSRARRLEHFEETFSSHSTGNILESMRSRREPSMEKNKQLINRGNQKLSLDSSFYMSNNNNYHPRLNSGKKMEKSLSLGEETSSNGLHDRVEDATSTSLEVPSLPSFLKSQSAEDLRQGSREYFAEDFHPNLASRRSSNHLIAPSLDRKRSRSFEHLTMPRINTPFQSKIESSRIGRQNSYCEERSQCQAQQNRLILPPLTRPRSKSFDELVEKKSSNQRLRAISVTDDQNESKKPQKPPASSPRRAKEKTENRKVSSFTKTTKNDDWIDDCSSPGEPGKLKKSSSTPDLTDLSSEVEYLLLEDDRTRLQRMRASVHALSLVNNLQDCRYIRSGRSDHHKICTSGETDLPANQPRSENDEHDAILEMIKNEPAVFTFGDDIETDQADDKNKSNIVSSLGASNTSTLAEMFEEIKKTRYLRMPGSPNEEEDVDDVLMTSHGYQTPLIIVGHTKFVFPGENNSEKTEEVF